MGWNGEPGFGVGLEPQGLIGHPFHPRDKVVSILTAHAMSHLGLVHNHKNCSTIIWTWYGTEGFLVHDSGQGSNRDLNPDG